MIQHIRPPTTQFMTRPTRAGADQMRRHEGKVKTAQHQAAGSTPLLPVEHLGLSTIVFSSSPPTPTRTHQTNTVSPKTASSSKTVSFKLLLTAAVAICRVAADFSDAYEKPSAELMAALQSPPAPDYDASAAAAAPAKRTVYGDPYRGYSCCSQYPGSGVPQQTSCTANNCYRSWLDARPDSPGFHCPSYGFALCCVWYSLTPGQRSWVVYSGTANIVAPWSTKCGTGGPFSYPSDADVQTVVGKIDKVCGCTLKHQISVSLPNAYYDLNPHTNFFSDPACQVQQD
ncbi:hypothetical protein QBC46DRAFT_343358 [Diplogelasinospora grovesii]|uniref:Uncharacterized protein n=1 Tax=Diplogelasinospora grovesii TaxID=303347 RepID=A0AAN6N3S8_9PEZI|nr:hypothetical protein QBC46DRAFT_343358 [Diplogelasinospora grovesii]